MIEQAFVNYTARNRWDQSDQEFFASISGDFNPIHLDPLEARKCVFGKSLVHGIHLVVWALNQFFLVDPRPCALVDLQAAFRKPVGLGEEAELSLAVSKTSVTARISCQDTVCVEISGDFSFGKKGCAGSWQQCFPSGAPMERSCEDLQGLSGSTLICGSITGLSEKYPALCACLPGDQIAALLTTTRLVGMECPGLRSIYSHLDISFRDGNTGDNALSYEVLEHNRVFNSLRIGIKGDSVHGEIKAFVRPILAPRDYINAASSMVVPGEFYGQRALVIGGSRGLGAIAATALALGGADVVATYAKGQKEMAKMVGELGSRGIALHSAAFDVFSDADILQGRIPGGWRPTHLYYFVTPFIFDGTKKKFSQRIFGAFLGAYVTGFWRVLESLVPHKTLRCVLYPSSSALDELPANMFEYAVAKAAGETMCSYVRKYFPGITVLCPRLQRLSTDQTVSIIPVENKDPLPVILEWLRKAQQEGSSA